ncbi:hypothetical protein HMPREF3213_04079 [Heyndrickxia coagulans]|uniref:Uncharacterized protein n=1 Tax=Heyndrickxia coagulans TaxID=1398 RepID=A0A133K953_HEYCO|nr:hypothetical protein HMPREF3213_04079 [Heyndrickxia coagulans]
MRITGETRSQAQKAQARSHSLRVFFLKGFSTSLPATRPKPD